MSLEKAVSYIATMKNKKEFTKQELKGIIAYELQWLKPGKAETLIEKAIKKGYLRKENSKIEIGIPTKKVSPNYEPDIDLDELDFDIEEAARLVRDGKGYEYISKRLDADVTPKTVRKAIDRYIEVNYR